jgi:hypothetical protein
MITVRLARPADWPLIHKFHVEQNILQQTSTALPKIFTDSGEFSPNIALAFVVERDGVPVSSFYFELVPEVCFAGCDPQATAVARREIDRIAFGLRAMGFTGINCKVPEHMAEAIAKPLEKAGFTEDEGLQHFFKDLRLPEPEKGE